MRLTAKVDGISFVKSYIRAVLAPKSDTETKTSVSSIKSDLNSINQDGVSFENVSRKGKDVIVDIKADENSNITQQDAVGFVKLLLSQVTEAKNVKIIKIVASYVFKLQVSNIAETESGDLAKIQKILSQSPLVKLLAKSDSGNNVYIQVYGSDIYSAERTIYSELKNKDALIEGHRTKLEFDRTLTKPTKKLETQLLDTEDEKNTQVPKTDDQTTEDTDEIDERDVAYYAATAYPSYLNTIEELFNAITLGSTFKHGKRSNTYDIAGSLGSFLDELDRNAEKPTGNHIVDQRKYIDYIMKQLSNLLWAKFRAERLRGAVYHDRIKKFLKKKPEYDSLLRKVNSAYIAKERAAKRLEDLASKLGADASKNQNFADSFNKAQQEYNDAAQVYKEQMDALIAKVPEAAPEFSVNIVMDALARKIVADGVSEKDRSSELRKRKNELIRNLEKFDYDNDTVYDRIEGYFLPEDLNKVIPNLFYIFPTPNEAIDKTISGNTAEEYIDTQLNSKLRQKYGRDDDVIKSIPDMEEKIRRILFNDKINSATKKREISELLPDTHSSDDQIKELVEFLSISPEKYHEINNSTTELAPSEVLSKFKTLLKDATGADDVSDPDVIKWINELKGPSKSFYKIKEKLPNTENVVELGELANYLNYYLTSLEDIIPESKRAGTIFLKLLNSNTKTEEKINTVPEEQTIEENIKTVLEEKTNTNKFASDIVDTFDNYKNSAKTWKADDVQNIVRSWLTEPRSSGTDARGVSETGAAKVPYEVVQQVKNLILQHWGDKNVDSLKAYLDTNFLLSKYDKKALNDLLETFGASSDQVKDSLGKIEQYSKQMSGELPPFFHTLLEDIDDIDTFNETREEYQEKLNELKKVVEDVALAPLENIKDTKTLSKETLDQLRATLNKYFSGVSLRSVIENYAGWQKYLDDNPVKKEKSMEEQLDDAKTKGAVDLDDAYTVAFNTLVDNQDTTEAEYLKKLYDDFISKGQTPKLENKSQKANFTLDVKKVLTALYKSLYAQLPQEYSTIQDFFEKAQSKEYNIRKHTINCLLTAYENLKRFYGELRSKTIGLSRDQLLQNALPDIHTFVEDSEDQLKLFKCILNSKSNKPFSEKRLENINSFLDDRIGKIKEHFKTLTEYKEKHGETQTIENLTDKLSNLFEIYTKIKHKVNKKTPTRLIKDVPVGDTSVDETETAEEPSENQKFNVPIKDLVNNTGTSNTPDSVDYGELHKQEEK